MHQKSRLLLPLLATTLLAGCSQFTHTNGQIDHVNNQAENYFNRDNTSLPPVQNTQKALLLGAEIHTRRHTLPSAVKQIVHFSSFQPLSLSQLSEQLTQITGVPIEISPQVKSILSDTQGQGGGGLSLPGLPGQGAVELPSLPNFSSSQNKIVVSKFSGPLYRLLNLMAAKAGVHWAYHDGQVRFFLTETRVFTVDVLPGGMINTSSISNASSGGGSATGSSGINDQANQTSSISAKTALYTSIVNNIKTILAQTQSAGGGGGGGASTIQIPTKVSASQTTGQVVVTASPHELHEVAKYIRAINKTMSKNVLIDVHIYSVTLNNSNNYNLNLNVALNSLGHGLSPLALTSPQSSNSTTGDGSISGGIVTSAVNASAVAQALASAGKVSLVTSGSILALNGQPTPLQVSVTSTYLASVSSTNTLNVGSQVTLTPGQYTTGFQGTFLPAIRGSNILLQYSIDLSQELSLTNVSSGGNSIELPTIATQAFMQRANLKSGQTVVLSGFKQINNSITHTGVGKAGFWGLGGGASESHQKSMLVIVMHVEKMGT
jgi:type IVB pilus formation R64 PilN family outer membrane protein